MKFTSKTDEQIAEANLVTKGFHLFEVSEAKEEKSSKGSDMITLKLKIIENGKEWIIKDWLVESFASKFKHFFQSIGLISKYEKGELSEQDCLGGRGKVEIIHKLDSNGVMRANVKDYIIPSDEELTKELSESDVPF